MSSILITGGLGFIGSHTAASLADYIIKSKNNFDYDIILVDNLSNSSMNVYNKLKYLYPRINFYFYQEDVLNEDGMRTIFGYHKIEYVIHMAALKAVGESIKIPLKYYTVNILGTLNILKLMKEYECNNLIFSSSATVYGTSSPPLNENSQTGINITNPYGKSKYMVEEILKDIAESPDNQINIVILRYFNPIGAHISGLLGENPKDIPNNLFPYIQKVAAKVYNKLTIFGDDYPTEDGTCIRDYVDIMDLADAHTSSIIYLRNNSNTKMNIFNIGTGRGYSVYDLINTFKLATGHHIPCSIGPRREGDLPVVYAAVSLETLDKLQWKPIRSLYESCYNGWNFMIKELNSN